MACLYLQCLTPSGFSIYRELTLVAWTKAAFLAVAGECCVRAKPGRPKGPRNHVELQLLCISLLPMMPNYIYSNASIRCLSSLGGDTCFQYCRLSAKRSTNTNKKDNRLLLPCPLVSCRIKGTLPFRIRFLMIADEMCNIQNPLPSFLFAKLSWI